MHKGIHYVTDGAGNQVAVQIDLKQHKKLWEDFSDALTATVRKAEPHAPWAEAKKRLFKPDSRKRPTDK